MHLRHLALGALLVGCDAAVTSDTPCGTWHTELRVERAPDPDLVDILFVVDGSASFEDDLPALHDGVVRALHTFVSGDTDGDGNVDFLPARSTRVGVISSDLSGSDAAQLRTEGDTSLPGCRATMPPYTTFLRGEDPAVLVHDVQCVLAATRGLGGREEPLEAALLALSPASPDATLPEGYTPPIPRPGLRLEGDGANAGFLREGSTLMIVFVGDEDDGSLAVSGEPLAGDPGLGSLAGDGLTPIERYVEGFLALRRNPASVVVALAGGLPADGAGDTGGAYEALLARDEMTERVDPADATRLVPACGTAFPARRLVSTLDGLARRGGGTTAQSLCSDDLRPLFSRIVELLWEGIGGVCLPRPLEVDDTGRVDCEVELVLPPPGEGWLVTRCDELGAPLLGTELDPLGRARERCLVRQLDRREALEGVVRGWYYDTSEEVMAVCGPTSPPGQSIALGAVLPSDHPSSILVRCRGAPTEPLAVGACDAGPR